MFFTVVWAGTLTKPPKMFWLYDLLFKKAEIYSAYTSTILIKKKSEILPV